MSTSDMVRKRIVVKPENKVSDDNPFEYAMQQGWLSRLKFNIDQKWYYYPEMRRDEVLAFKTFDSRNPTCGRGIAYNPHSAFLLENFQSNPLRESLEVRIVCLLPPNGSV